MQPEEGWRSWRAFCPQSRRTDLQTPLSLVLTREAAGLRGREERGPRRRLDGEGSPSGSLLSRTLVSYWPTARTTQFLDHLDLVSRIAVDGDGTSALSMTRREVPRLVAALRVLVDEHQPDENGHCRKWRGGPVWRRVSSPCRMLLNVHLAAGAATATTRDRACWQPRRHRIGGN